MLSNFQLADLDLLMNFRVSCELEYNLQDPATFLFALQCIETEGQHVLSESLVFQPFVGAEALSPVGGGMNRFSRIKTLNPGPLGVFYEAEVAITPLAVSVSHLISADAASLGPEILPYLFPSRYCQSDRLRQMGMELFGHLRTPYTIAAAVSDWVFENIAYVSGSSGENCSAIDTLDLGQGVCRDFAHLGIAFCRAMNVPARYTTCYAYQLQPQDFHACFEVFIGDSWYLFDATRLVPLNGLIRIATGRDAADAAVCTIFGNPELTLSTVACECMDPKFFPMTHKDLANRGELIFLP
ncbi:transglutaminase family protein [bacterium]|nr:transglutaminase family protein [bacterium]